MMRKPGRFEKDLFELKEWIISELEESPKRWSELWNKERFGSEKHLSECLKQLIEEGVITQQVKSHKNRPYMLTEDFEAFQTVFSERFQKGWSEVSKDVLSSIVKGIKLSELTPSEANIQITVLLIEQLGNTLNAAEFVTKMPEKFRDYAAKEFKTTMEGLKQILSYFGETEPEITKSSINITKFILWDNIVKMKIYLRQEGFITVELPEEVVKAYPEHIQRQIRAYPKPSFLDPSYFAEEEQVKKEYDLISVFYKKRLNKQSKK